MKDVVRRFVEHGGDFDAVALALFRWQCAHNPHYAAIAEGLDPQRAEELPAVPVALFKQLALRSFDPAGGEVTFRTSGTTGQVRGEVHLQDTTLYDFASPRHFRACVPDVPGRIVSLCPDEPDSSLGHMVRLFGDVTPWFRDGAVTVGELEDPVFFATTAFALDAWFAQGGTAALTPESVVMVTGGFKGRRVRLDHAGLYATIGERLGRPRVVGEYGMSELSSQLWTDPVPAGAVPGAFRAPPWLRVFPVDPATGDPVDGVGVLRFVDLCNVDTVVAIETMDLGAVDGDRVTLHGRLEGAEARGCSLRAEELLDAATRHED